MKELFRYEFRKLFRSKSFYVIFAVQIAVILIGIFSTKSIENMIGDPGYLNNVTGVSQMLGVISGTIFFMVSAIFVSIFLCEDYGAGTIKNIVGHGYSRIKVSFSKYVVCFVGVLIATIASMAVAFVVATIFWKSGNWDESATKTLIGELVYLTTYHAFFCFVATLFTKVGAAIAINLVGPLFLNLLLTLVDSLTNIENFSFSNYFFVNIGSSFASSGYACEKFGLYIGIMLIYFACFFAGGLFVSDKKEF